MVEGHQDLRMKGIKLLSMYAGFEPNDRRFDYIWEYATRHGLPVLLHTRKSAAAGAAMVTNRTASAASAANPNATMTQMQRKTVLRITPKTLSP